MRILDRLRGMIRPAQQRSFCPSGSASLPMNWWQIGLDRTTPDAEKFGPVYACVKIIAEEIARLHLRHMRKRNDLIDPVTTSSAARVFRNPNSYQTRSDFWLMMMWNLLYTGNAYAVATRNNRFEIDALWPQPARSCQPMIDPQSGDIYYNVAYQDVSPMDMQSIYPARDVLHLRLFCPRDPLLGESPISAAVASIVSGTAQRDAEAAFFQNQSRPSGVLSTDHILTKEQVSLLRDMWGDQSHGMATGKVPILTAGLKWQPLGMSATDAQAIESWKMSVEDIARVFRMPPYMLADYSNATYNNTEVMGRTFYNSCLGFYLEHIEAALNRLFDFSPNETAEFDIERGLLRGELKERMEAYARGIQGGVIASNEARRRLDLPPVEGGDQVLVQQQMVPIDQAGQSQAPAPEPQPEPAEPVDIDAETDRMYLAIKGYADER